MFRHYLHRDIERGVKTIVEAMRAITEDSILGCWCVDLEGETIFTEPERCHCQLIAKAWRWMKQEK